MAWSPTGRRHAIGGLISLWLQPAWRESSRSEEIRTRLRASLRDQDEIVRFRTVGVIGTLENDTPSLNDLIRELILAEENRYVFARLLEILTRMAWQSSNFADQLLAEIMELSRWDVEFELTNPDEQSEEVIAGLVHLTLVLAFGREMPVASALTEEWSREPLSNRASRVAVSSTRNWLELPENRRQERRRSFSFLANASEALVGALSEFHTDDDRLAEAYRLANAISDDLYFASGAFGDGSDDHNPVPAQPGFSEEAFPIIQMLTAFKHPEITYHLVQTLGHLAHYKPKLTFQIVNQAISSGDSFTFDQLAADATIALIARYFAEFRDVVVNDVELISAIRTVLEAFVRVGWPKAVTLSYELGDAFR